MIHFRMSMAEARSSKRCADRPRHHDDLLLVELLLVGRLDGRNAISGVRIVGRDDDDELARFMRNDAVRSLELPGRIDDAEAIGKAWRYFAGEKARPFALPDDDPAGDAAPE